MFGLVTWLTDAALPTQPLCWLLMTVGWGLVFGLGMVFKLIAFKNDKITRVYPIYYLESVLCLLADVFIFNEDFKTV